MNCLIIGYGSIGARHAHILRDMGHDVHVVSRRRVSDFSCTRTVKEAFRNRFFQYAVISNETELHYKSLMELKGLGYSGAVLIEKPLFHCWHPVLETELQNVFVAYNLRFHPVIQRLRELLKKGPLFSIQIYAGQYLPDWRPGTDYAAGYSASKKRGGGVLRDLSHELDYATWIAGSWKKIAAIGGKFSKLRIDSNDVYSLLLETDRCPAVAIQINYLDRKSRREVIVNSEGLSIKADLIANTLEVNNTLARFDVERNLTYLLQHRSILEGESSNVCTLRQGLDILKLVYAAELAASRQVWIDRSDVNSIL